MYCYIYLYLFARMSETQHPAKHESEPAMKSKPMAKFLPEGTHLREYVIKSVIGSGGFGITYLAKDNNLSRQVVIKEFFPELMAIRETSGVAPQDKDTADLFDWSLKRFMEEARVIASFDHPNIVRVLQYFRENNTAYFVMPLLVGTDLKTVITQRKNLITEEEMNHWLAQLLDGLEVVHQQGFLHRDIKPANILICDNGKRPVLIDFGSARNAYHNRSRSLAVMITKGYSPIEQYSLNSEQGPFTDIYSLGATFYAIIRGKLPPDAMARVEATFSNDLPDPCESLASNHDIKLDLNLLKAIDWALSIHGRDRPRTIADWRAVLFPASQSTPNKKSENKLPPAPIILPTPNEDKTIFYSPDHDIWPKVVAKDCREGYQSFIKDYPNSIYVFEAQAAIARHEEIDRRSQADTQAWAIAKELNTITGYRQYLEKIPWGNHRQTALEAIAELDESAWRTAVAVDTIEAYRQYEIEVPDGVHTAHAQSAIARLEEAKRERQRTDEAAWAIALTTNHIDSYRRYQATCPNGAHVDEAEQAVIRLNEVERQRDQALWESTLNAPDQLDACLDYACTFPQGIHADEVDAFIEKTLLRLTTRQSAAAAAWEATRVANTLESYRNFLRDWPDSDRMVMCLEHLIALRTGDRQTSATETHTILSVMPTSGTVVKGEGGSIEWYRKAAAQGSAQAQTNLGVMLSNGRGVSKDEVAAIKWYRKAADQGYAPAQFNLGVMLADGRGVAKDEVAAVEWFRKAAIQGNAYAQFNLGRMLERGRGIAKDDASAVEWYRKAAAQGNTYAQFNLARMLERGYGVAQDETAAAEWYQKAAAQGNANAQNNLGVMLEIGRGVAQDKTAAIECFRKAAAQGHSNARDNLNRMLSGCLDNR